MIQTQDPNEPDDLDAVADRAVAGDPVAVRQLLTLLQPMITRYCRARLRSGPRGLSGADDVAQEVFMAVVTGLRTYRRQPAVPFVAFVYRICANKVTDAHRAAGRTHSFPVAEVPDGVSTERGPEQLAVQGSVATTMHGLLATLPEQQQEILRLRVVVGMTAEEVAGALGMTAGAVRVAQHRSLAKLRVVLSDDLTLREQLV